MISFIKSLKNKELCYGQNVRFWCKLFDAKSLMKKVGHIPNHMSVVSIGFELFGEDGNLTSECYVILHVEHEILETQRGGITTRYEGRS